MGEADAEKLLVAEKLGGFQLAVRPLEVAAIDPPDDKRKKPVWASDVSQAIKRLFGASNARAGGAATPEVSVRVYAGKPGGDGFLCSKSACVRSDVSTITPDAASQTSQNHAHAIPIELR